MHSGIKKVATICNGISECVDGLDETSFCSNSSLSYAIIGVVCMILLAILLTVLRINTLFLKSEILPTDPLILKPNAHCTIQLSTKINIKVMKFKYMGDLQKWKTICCKIYDFEYKIHGESDSEAFCCLKNNLDPNVVQIIKDFKFPGFLQKTLERCPTLLQKIQKLKESMARSSKVYLFKSLEKKLKTISFYYLDVFKDFGLLTTIFVAAGSMSIFDFPTKFTSVVIFCFLFSVLVPLFISSIHLAKNFPEVYLGVKKKNLSSIKARQRRKNLAQTKLKNIEIFYILSLVFNNIL